MSVAGLSGPGPPTLVPEWPRSRTTGPTAARLERAGEVGVAAKVNALADLVEAILQESV